MTLRFYLALPRYREIVTLASATAECPSSCLSCRGQWMRQTATRGFLVSRWIAILTPRTNLARAEKRRDRRVRANKSSVDKLHRASYPAIVTVTS